VSEIIDLVQKTAIRQLTQRSGETLDRLEVAAIKGVAANRDVILEAFTEGLLRSFDELLGRASEQEAAVCNFETLSLVQESELEVMVAVEGMVAAARNRHLAHFISFNTRLNSRLSDRIDESNNPMDPEQIAAAFQDAVRPLGLSSGDSLTLFRGFNGCVLKSLDEVLHACNGVLIEHGVIPDLGLDSARPTASARRRTPRSPLEDADVSSFGSVAAERFDEQQNQPELFSIMQNLMHGDASLTATPAPAVAQTDYVVPAELLQQAVSTEGPGQPVTIVDQQKLMQILSDIQNVLDTRTDGDGSESDEILPLDRELLATSLGQQLEQNAESGVTNAVDRHSSDVINLVTMLYEAIWQDESVPIPIKELIGRTQITIIKVALSDTTFFNVEDHPARALLNEFAAAGIGRNEVEDLHEDPLYVKMQQLITSILEEYDDGPDFFEKHVSGRFVPAKHARHGVSSSASCVPRNARRDWKTSVNWSRKRSMNEFSVAICNPLWLISFITHSTNSWSCWFSRKAPVAMPGARRLTPSMCCCGAFRITTMPAIVTDSKPLTPACSTISAKRFVLPRSKMLKLIR
jgi:hypothetical protein